MNPDMPAHGLYAITDSRLTPPQILTEQVAAAIAGGAVLIQYRDKQADARQRRERAGALLTVCRQHRVPLIINDDVELAALLGTGVHLGHEDTGIAQARARLGPRVLLGASCYNDLQRARAAVAAGADYVAFGRFYASHSKPQALPAGPALLGAARRELAVPVVAIGGITPDNGAALIAAGADLLAAIEGVFGGADAERAAGAYTALFGATPAPPETLR